MTTLALYRRFNYRNIRLTHRTRGHEVGYYTRSGQIRFVPWLGFIDRNEARSLRGGSPVRLADISRIAWEGQLGTQWRHIKEDECVQGCLTRSGAYAVLDIRISLVPAKQAQAAPTQSRPFLETNQTVA